MILVMAMLFACKRDIKTVVAYGEIDTLPELTARNIEYIRSDSGEIQAILTSPLMYQYSGDDEHIIFPDGFKSGVLRLGGPDTVPAYGRIRNQLHEEKVDGGQEKCPDH